MDRRPVYVGELPRFEDFLGFQRDTLYAIGDIVQATIGSGVEAHGLACAPTSPASLQVTVGPGAIYSQQTVDASAFGALGTDANTITKQGQLKSPVTLTLTPPATSGYSQVYLIQAAYNDVDSGSIVLPYYNSANPSQPLNGPNGSGAAQYTIRSGVCAISLKAGAAAATGSQVAPVADSGYSPLYLITVANGQTQITSANISVHSSAPFIPITLPQVPSAIQQQAGNWAVDTGASANVINITLPASTSLIAGLPLRIKKGNVANTGAMTMVVTAGSPLSPVSVIWEDGSALQSGDWPANAVGEGVFDGTAFRIGGPIGPAVFQRAGGVLASASLVHVGPDTSSTPNVITATVSPSITTYDTGAVYNVKIANKVTGATVANLNTLGSKNVVRPDGSALQNGDLVVGQEARLVYDGTALQITAVSPPAFALIPAPTGTTFYVNGSTGNDSNDGLTSGTAFLTMLGSVSAISTKYSSASGITINVASGTYAGFTIPASNIGSWTIIGNTTTPSSVTISSPTTATAFGRAVNVAYGATVTLEGMTFASTLQNVSNLGSCFIYNCTMAAPGTSGYSALGCYGAAFMRVWGTINYSGSAQCFVEAGQGAEIQLGYADAAGNLNFNLTISGTPAWNLGFANVSQCASLVAYSSVMTISGAATGPRYNARLFGTIQTFGAGATFFPGNASGTYDYSQQYQ